MYLVALYSMSIIIFVDEKKEFYKVELVGEGRSQDFVVRFVNQEGFSVESCPIRPQAFVILLLDV